MSSQREEGWRGEGEGEDPGLSSSSYKGTIRPTLGASLLAQPVKNLTAMQEMPEWGRSLKKGMAAHSSILTWRIPWTEEPGGLQSMVLQRVTTD